MPVWTPIETLGRCDFCGARVPVSALRRYSGHNVEEPAWLCFTCAYGESKPLPMEPLAPGDIEEPFEEEEQDDDSLPTIAR